MEDARFPEESLKRFADYRRLNDGRPRLWSIIENDADASQLAAYASLFWPAFIEVKGCVLLAAHYYEDAFQGWWEKLNGDRQRIELMINNLEVGYLCAQRELEFDPRVETAIANSLAGCWRAALEDWYPKRIFDVKVTAATDNASAEVTFSMVR